MVIAASMFIGTLVFLSGSAAQSIPELGELEGTGNFQSFEPGEYNLNLDNYIEKSSIEEEDGDLKWDGTVNDRGEEYGYVRYDVTGIDERISIELRSFLFDQIKIIFENSTGSVIREDSVVASPQQYNLSELDDPAVLEIQMKNQNHRLEALNIVNPDSGWITTAQNFAAVFTGLSSNTEWFNLIVGIPLAIAGFYILLQIIKFLVPLT